MFFKFSTPQKVNVSPIRAPKLRHARIGTEKAVLWYDIGQGSRRFGQRLRISGSWVGARGKKAVSEDGRRSGYVSVSVQRPFRFYFAPTLVTSHDFRITFASDGARTLITNGHSYGGAQHGAMDSPIREEAASSGARSGRR